jgi:hypothetical protein
MRRGVLVGLLVALTVAYAVLNWPGKEYSLLTWWEQVSPADQLMVDSTRVIDPLPSNLPVVSVLIVPPDKMRAALSESYRLRPDKRFLHAVAEIHHLLTGQERAAVTVEFKDGIWLVRYGDTQVGALPEFPDFSHSLSMLELWAKLVSLNHPLCLAGDEPGQPRVGASRAPVVHPYWCRFPWHLLDKKPKPEQLDEITTQLDRFWAPEAAAAARQLDSLWRSGVRNPALLKAATRALVYLNLQVLDRMETADLLAGKALAVLALTKALTDVDVAHEEVLLAEAMEYTAHAERVGRSLAQTDPARHFASHDAPSLVRLAQAQDANTETRYLALLRIAELHRPELLEAWRATYFPQDWWSLPSLKAELELRDFVTNRVLAESLPRIALLALAQEAGMPSLAQIAAKRRQANSQEELDAIMRSVEAILAAETSTLVDRFDTSLEVLTPRYPGPFLDAETYHTYFRAHFYSSLYILGLHYLDALSSAQAASQFAATLGQSEKGTAKQFRQWYLNLAQSKSSKGDPSAMFKDLSQMPHFGAAPLLRTYEEQEKHFRFGDPMLPQALKVLARRTDSRPSHRFDLGMYANSALLDLNLTDTLLRSAIDVDPRHRQGLQAWHAYFTGNHERLLELLRSPVLAPKEKAVALGYLQQLDAMSPDALRNEYLALIAANPTSWELRNASVDHLAQRKQFSEARAVIVDWLSSHDGSAGFDYLFALNKLSKMYYLDERYQEGLGVLAPILANQQGGSLQRAALILDKLGRPEDAEKMAAFLVNRYPDNLEFRTVMAELFWRHGKYDDATQVFKTSPYPINAADWRFTIGDRFAEVFRDRPNSEALMVFSRLLEGGISHWSLREFALPVGKMGNHELAFKMLSQLRVEGLDNLGFLFESYRHMKAWQGKPTALIWLRGKLGSARADSVSGFAFQEQEYDLLWDLIERPDETEHPEFTWMMRAAISLKQDPGNNHRRETVLEYYSKNRSTHYDAIARYLLGLATQEEVLALATDPDKRCEIAFYLGWRSQAEGRYQESSDWYRVAVETGLTRNGEYHWAYGRLYVWYTHGKSLLRLAADKR